MTNTSRPYLWHRFQHWVGILGCSLAGLFTYNLIRYHSPTRLFHIPAKYILLFVYRIWVFVWTLLCMLSNTWQKLLFWIISRRLQKAITKDMRRPPLTGRRRLPLPCRDVSRWSRMRSGATLMRVSPAIASGGGKESVRGVDGDGVRQQRLVVVTVSASPEAWPVG